MSTLRFREAPSFRTGDAEERSMGSTNRKNKGQSLVEFMLVAPILLVLLVGIAEFGRAWMAQSLLTGAAREAVRILAVDPIYGGGPGPANIRASAILLSGNINGANVVLDSGTVPFDPVTATVSYNFPLAVAGFVPGLPANFTLTSSTSMRREY
jgi:Flp pilus assembly protein TadG